VPDVFVPLEVEHGNGSTAYLLQSGIVGNFVFEQLDKNRSAFKGLTFAQFQSKMNQTEAYFNSFQKFIFGNGLDLKFGKSKSLVKRYLAAEFARQLYGERSYYEIILKEDAMIKAILKK
ncbi:peptidase S41, partial [Flavobacterium franklandianum]